MNTNSDPLVRAITEGTLSSSQRNALADVVQVLINETSGASVAPEQRLMDQIVVSAGRWDTLSDAWRAVHGDLYPRAAVTK